MSPSEDNYPTLLRGRSAANLSIKGDLDRLNRRLVWILPSDKPDEQERKDAHAYLAELAREQVTCLIGYGPGVERAIIRTMLEQRRDVVILFTAGITEFAIRKDLRDVWDETLVTVISAASPFQKWQPALASTAHDIAILLSSAVLVTDPSPRPLARYTRDSDGWQLPPVFYVDRERDNMPSFVLLNQIGARPLRHTSDLRSLIEIVRDSHTATTPKPGKTADEHGTAAASLQSTQSRVNARAEQLPLLPVHEGLELVIPGKKRSKSSSRKKSPSQPARKRKDT